jgi:hypothetical protein
MIVKILLGVVLACDPALTRLFTPPHPQLGSYQVCTAAAPVARLMAYGGPRAPHFGPPQELEALDAFGAAGPYDRSALARLYGGRRATVVRGWAIQGDVFESVTLVSPYPDASLSRLIDGTMVIVLRLPQTQPRSERGRAFRGASTPRRWRYFPSPHRLT